MVQRGKATTMMGSKERHFAPLIHVSVEELVPQDHFYRHVERTLVYLEVILGHITDQYSDRTHS
jgi:hypothetical protein